MSVASEPVRLDFDDYVRFTETHRDGAFELIDGVIFKLLPEGDAHLRTRSAIDWTLNRVLDATRYTSWTEASFPAPGWFDGPRPDNFVSRGPGIVAGVICERPRATDIALAIEVSSSTRKKDDARATLYARLGIPEYWLVDLDRATIVVHRLPEFVEQMGHRYAQVTNVGRHADLTAASVDGLSIATDFLLQLSLPS